jgi:crotonobetainyl-CoA:carnitine CoA-transferase CaiB-like acyl-CoA transferase
MWRTFCKLAGHEAWATDERFRTNADRVQNRRALSSLMEPVILTKTTEEWLDLLRSVGIPCGKIQSVGEVCEDPQVLARDMVVKVDHPKAGALRVTGVPVKLSDTPGAVTLPPPLLGEHTPQVLTEWLHLSTGEVDRLRQAGAL